MKKAIYLLFAIYLSSCIGTTEVERNVDLPDSEDILIINASDTAVLIGESIELMVSIISDAGSVEAEGADWFSSDTSVASVTSTGLITGNTVGSVFIWTTHDGLTSDSTVVNVVANSTDLSMISIASSMSSLIVGDSVQLSALGEDLDGNAIAIPNGSWFSSDESVASINQDGWLFASGTNTGEVNVQLNSGDIMSNVLKISIVDLTAQMREGTIVPPGGYNVQGDVVLLEDIDGDIILRFKENFFTQSGPGLYVYLSNESTNILANGIEVVTLPQTSGAFEINVSDFIPNIGLNDFNKVIIHCKPFNVPFGIADLN